MIKKITKFILIFLFLFTNNSYSGVKETGSGPIEERILNNVKNRFNAALEANPDANFLIYIALTSDGEFHSEGKMFDGKIKNKDHKEVYKNCKSLIPKGEDCFLFAINREIVWTNLVATSEGTAASEGTDEGLAILDKDKKSGRFFKDQPDVTDDYQIHFIYFLGKKSKDKERDLNGWIEKQVKKSDDLFFKMTGNKQRFKFDYREDGKLDISFVRMDRIANKRSGWNMQYPDYFLQKNGFNNPKKMYFSFVETKHQDGGMMGPHHGYLFIKSVGSVISQVVIHELLHGLGFAMPCTKGVTRGAHLNSGILGPDLDRKLGKAIYEHGDPTCPDLKDSAYLTPTSDTPFDPIPIACALAQKVRGTPPGNYEIPARYTHKKLLKGRENEWCTYKLSEYAEMKWFRKWKK